MLKESDADKVSIVLPVYNGEQYLKGAIETCLNQTYDNIELIIVDDCSTDSTPEIIKSFHDGRIKYFRHKKNKMLPGALNTGFKHATGDYLTWTSDDNEYFLNAIETMVACLKEHGNSGLAYADYWVINEMTGDKRLRRLDDPLHLDTYNGLGACFLYTRNVYEVIGEYNTSLGLVEDYDYWIRVAKTFATYHVVTPLYLYREHGGSLTSTKLAKIIVMDRMLKYMHGYLPETELLKAFDGYINEISENRKSVVDAIKNFLVVAVVLYRNLPSYLNKYVVMFVLKIIHYMWKMIGRKLRFN